MCRFLVSLIFLSIVGCVFSQHHHINREGVQIRGSFGASLKDDGLPTTRLGDHSDGTGKRIQIRGHFGGISDSVNLGGRLGERNNTNASDLSESQPQVTAEGGGLSGSDTETGIGSESVALNSILENAGLGGGPESDSSGSVARETVSDLENDGSGV